MAAAAGIFNQPAAQALPGNVAPMAASSSGNSGASGSTGASDGSATISANDFLTLLVTEMQNQDPTTATDPNEYINQLVEVNSLEQLVSINQTLSGALGAPASGTSKDASAPVALTSPGMPAISSAASAAPGSQAATHPPGVLQAPGNLSIPAAEPAAQRVAHALDGRRAVSMPASLQ